jgi:hypothetical protein
VCGDKARVHAVDNIGADVTAGPLRDLLAFEWHCRWNRGGVQASLGSLESLDDEEVRGAWPAVSNTPMSPDLSSLAATVYGCWDGHDLCEGSWAPRHWHE